VDGVVLDVLLGVAAAPAVAPRDTATDALAGV
jgi:hypothetical protein